MNNLFIKFITEKSQEIENENSICSQKLLELEQKYTVLENNLKNNCKEIDILKKEREVFENSINEKQTILSQYVLTSSDKNFDKDPKFNTIRNELKEIKMITKEINERIQPFMLLENSLDKELRLYKSNYRKIKKELKSNLYKDIIDNIGDYQDIFIYNDIILILNRYALSNSNDLIVEFDIQLINGEISLKYLKLTKIKDEFMILFQNSIEEANIGESEYSTLTTNTLKVSSNKKFNNIIELIYNFFSEIDDSNIFFETTMIESIDSKLVLKGLFFKNKFQDSETNKKYIGIYTKNTLNYSNVKESMYLGYFPYQTRLN